MSHLKLALIFALSLFPATLFAQYTPQAGKSEAVAEEEQKSSNPAKRVEETPNAERGSPTIKRDKHGNAGGPQFDLAYDGAFEGQTIVVMFLVPWGDFNNAKAALETKGFKVVVVRDVPKPKTLKGLLAKTNQFWLVSSCGESNDKLNSKHLSIIESFYKSGHGLYLWGDNDPCNDEANYVASRIFDIEVRGDVPGDKVVSFRTKKNRGGLLRDHLITTGSEQLYEGVTVATVKPNDSWTPFLWGSAGNIVAAFNDNDRRRAIIDGGMTRLYFKWDTAGTGRYVVNAASWLANYERFGAAILGETFRANKKK